MNDYRFERPNANLNRYFQELDACPEAPREYAEELIRERCLTNRGVYVLYEDNRPKYVGRSNRIRQRVLNEHVNPNRGRAACAREISTMHTLVRFRTENPDPVFRRLSDKALRNSLRRALSEQADLRNHYNNCFNLAIQRISAMGIKVVRIEDQIEQALFEVLVHYRWETPYNNRFENH